MQTFAQEVNANRRYRSLKRASRLDHRAIEECIIGIGEAYAAKIVRQFNSKLRTRNYGPNPWRDS